MPGPKTYTLTASASGGGTWGDIALLFSSVAGVGASSSANGTGSASLTFTTTGNNSAISVIALDWNGVSGTNRTWLTLNGVTPSLANGYELAYALDTVNGYTAYVAYYPDAGNAGPKTVGLSAPTGMKYTIIAVEVQGAQIVGQKAAIKFGFNIASRPAWVNVPASLPVGLAVSNSSVGYRLNSTTLSPGFSLSGNSALKATAKLPVGLTLKSGATGWTYISPVPVTYLQYLSFGGDLSPKPGQFVYYIVPASGSPYPLPVPPHDGRWEDRTGQVVMVTLPPGIPAPLTSMVKRYGMESLSGYGEAGKKK